MRNSTNENMYTRRTVVHGGLTAALAAGVAPSMLYADKAGAGETIVGDGEYKYRCEHDWARANLPAGHNYGGASHGTAVDSQGHIYISHQGGPASIFVFDDKGKFVRSLAPFDKGAGHGIDIRNENGDDFIYLAPSNASKTFHKIDMKGELVWKKGKADFIEESDKYNAKSRYRPTNTSFTPDGGFHLGDGYGNNCIMQYDSGGKYLRTIGGGGKADGQFQTPHGQWLDDRDGTPKLAVADRANARLQWFDMEGKHLKTLGGFLFPADLDTMDDLLLVPDLHCRITILGKDDKVVAQLGGHDAEGETFEQWKKAALHKFQMRRQRDKWKPGRFIHPHDACFDKNGDIYVAEWVSGGRVTKLTRVK